MSTFACPETLLIQSSSASLTARGSRTTVWAEASSCLKIYLFSKVSVSEGRIFFLQYVQINLVVDFQALINERQTRFAHVWCNSSPNHIANRFLGPKLTSDVDWWVSRAIGINFVILLIGHSFTVDIQFTDQMKILLAAGFISLNINLPLSHLFSFEDSETTFTDCFLYEVGCRSSTIPVAMKTLRFQHILPFSNVSLRNSLHLLRCKNYDLGADCARSSRICVAPKMN